MNQIYHVAKTGFDYNSGTEEAPFLTIQRAAREAKAGDTVLVHEGVYREWVRPLYGGVNDNCRVTYQAAEGEHVAIRGSEEVKNWKRLENGVWQAEVSNRLFGDFNPFAEKIQGDWLVDPRKYDVHCGAVYLDGVMLYEARCPEEVERPVQREYSELATWGNRKEAIRKPEQSLLVWRAEVGKENTVITANFGGADPNEHLVEINVRRACFYPDKSGVNFITLRGFEIAQAATNWAPPTADQVGMVGPNWAKGWIIEENLLHDSKCSAVSLGKNGATGDNEYTRTLKKPDYQYQMEAMFRGLGKGWSKEQVGSHIVRNNTIYDCGQTGVVGHMGCAFSEIYGNDISYIATRHEFWGHEIAGIKFHAAVDARIYDNHIHHCSLGTWLDWEAQGVRVSGNVYDHNNRDFMVEVTHGPYLADNNIFASEYNFDNAAQGGAYVHNLCCGLLNQYPVLDRPTPYHMPHSTQVMGSVWVYGFDDRWYQNLFAGGSEEDKFYGTGRYNGAPVSLEEYLEKMAEYDPDPLRGCREIKQPVYIRSNVYLRGAESFDREEGAVCLPEWDPEVSVESCGQEVFLNITLPEEVFGMDTVSVTTELLGAPRITECQYENPDGSPIAIDRDLTGGERGGRPLPGPLQGLKPGRNRVSLGRFGRGRG
ncbi:MAG: right-handed parallel beta-helix repeat-containing protein [Roseburia sp.]|nr:right-handed parallel beta-helix repeat-containing protein [Roseburia sp.]MCM1098400.1 right-handed parallel beta-helix repeat-containing protein [Ruminococcus flavefaciens]